ncbi:MAG: helix-turn-helix domain-containing protein [Planctomycetota bacterium]
MPQLDHDRVFAALAGRSRRRLLDRLFAGDGLTLGALCRRRGMSRQAVSKHLAILERAGLVVAHWQGREKLHYLNPVPLHEIHTRWIAKFQAPRLEALQGLKTALERK